MKLKTTIFLAISMAFLLLGETAAQETDRAGMAIEFPELNTGMVLDIKSYVPKSEGLTSVNFWILEPVAKMAEKVRLKINNESAMTVCSQSAKAAGKVFRCNLSQYARLHLRDKENRFEIEAEGPNGKRLYASFLVITDATKVPERPDTPSGRKFAVIFGVSKYSYNDAGLGNLAYADADADALYTWLTTKGGFLPNDVLHLTNENATLNAVRDSLTRFLNKAAETDLILFYFAGHGTPDPYNPTNLYYLVHDSKVTNLKQTGFPMVELKEIIDKNLRSKRAIFLLDTCHSAGLNGKNVVGVRRGKDGDRGLLTDDDRQLQKVEVRNNVSDSAINLFRSTGRAVLTSSDVNESSRESTKWGGGHGVFTWAIIEGLNGKSDTNGDRVVTADELFAFVRDFVKKETGAKQNPRLFSNLGANIELAVIK